MRKYFHANISSVCVSDSSAKCITHENFYAYGTQFPACTGHAEEDKQVAFLQLCILLQKKGSSDCFVYIYEDSQVHYDYVVCCDSISRRPHVQSQACTHNVVYKYINV